MTSTSSIFALCLPSHISARFAVGSARQHAIPGSRWTSTDPKLSVTVNRERGDFWGNENMTRRMYFFSCVLSALLVIHGRTARTTERHKYSDFMFRFSSNLTTKQGNAVCPRAFEYIKVEILLIIHIGANVTICESINGNNNEVNGIVSWHYNRDFAGFV